MGRRKKENLNVKPARQEYEDKLKPMRRLTKDWKTIKAILYEDWTYEKRENYHSQRFYSQWRWELQVFEVTGSVQYKDDWTYKVMFSDEEWKSYIFETDKKTEVFPCFWFEDRKIG